MIFSRSIITLGLVAWGTLGSACSSAQIGPTERDVLDAIADHPEQHDGAVLDVEFFLFDIGSDDSYAVCFTPCTLAEVSRSVVILLASAPGKFDGSTGQTPVPLRVRFNAECFLDDHVCSPHVFYIFEEIA